jgi:hypothetical protein
MNNMWSWGEPTTTVTSSELKKRETTWYENMLRSMAQMHFEYIRSRLVQGKSKRVDT